jgi:hypothetical protein
MSEKHWNIKIRKSWIPGLATLVWGSMAVTDLLMRVIDGEFVDFTPEWQFSAVVILCIRAALDWARESKP